MKLKSVAISEFQSIRNSGPFEISDITCLVGKNESGKTALLKALYRLNPLIPTNPAYDPTDDYPRAFVEDYRLAVESGERPPANVVTATFWLCQDDVRSLVGAFGPEILEQNELTLSKGYANVLDVQLSLNEGVAVRVYVNQAQLPSSLDSELSALSTIEELAAVVDTLTTPENAEHVNRLRQIIQPVKQAGTFTGYVYQTYLAARVPRFLYFDEYNLLRGLENIESLKNRQATNKPEPSDLPLLSLIKLARLNLDDLQNASRTEEVYNKLEGASNHLSNKILQYWSQNRHLRLKFDLLPARKGDPAGFQTGTNLWIRVYDSKHQVTTQLGSRSRGFVWFFSFLAWYSQQERKAEPLILLLDEPGLFLHGRAQGDLLRYMEQELRKDHQVIYTTHSPFMVDAEHFERVRIVQDKGMDTERGLPPDEEGTKVLSDVLEATEDSLFPLQGALGYDMYQTLFVGPCSLVVEGVSDLLYLQTMSGILEAQGREGLSPQWTITPVGGSDKVPTFVSLLGAQRHMKIATLVDFQKKDQQVIENLYKKRLLKKQHVLTYADFVGAAEADVEDMFGSEFYLALVNCEYRAHLKLPITESALTAQAPRLLVRLEEYFKRNPLQGGMMFNHYRPARYFTEHATELANTLPSAALDAFEAAFKSMNKLV